MKTAFLYRYAILGGCTVQLQYRRELIRSGIEPHFIFGEEHGGTSAFGDYPYVTVQTSERSIASYLERHAFDVIAVLDDREYLELTARIGFSGKVVCEVHTTYEHVLNYLEDGRAVARVDRFVAPSRYLSKLILDRCPQARKQGVDVVADAVDAQRFKPSPEENRRPQTSPIVLWVGKLDDHKNWRGFLRAARRIHEMMPNAAFYMVGGETALDEVVMELMTEIRTLDLFSHVHWIQRVEYSHMPVLYRLVGASGGCLLVTSQAESFCMAVLEAMCCGCPVVAPRHTALPELLGEGRYGLLYSPDELAESAAHVRRIVTDREMRKRLIDTATTEVPDRYDVASCMAKYADLLRTLS